MVEHLQTQLRQNEDKVAELEAMIEQMKEEEEKRKATQPGFPGGTGGERGGGSGSLGSGASVGGSSCGSLLGTETGQFGDDKFVLSLRNVEMNERISSDTGSGCVVFVCNVDGWQCAAKVLSLEGIPASQVAKFESEGSFFVLLFVLLFYCCERNIGGLTKKKCGINVLFPSPFPQK